ncbi:MAG: hypothetical protein NXI29_00525 [bacterium]|nr:hypothetical protein [bacterium]
MNEPEFTFSEPILIATPGGRFTWLKRVFITYMWCLLVVLVLQGLTKVPAKHAFLQPIIMTGMIAYSILCQCIRRKIEVSKYESIELYVLPGVNNKVINLSTDSPIMILDSPGGGNLRKIQLLSMHSHFMMFITEDEAKRLASWADDNSKIAAYRRNGSDASKIG